MTQTAASLLAALNPSMRAAVQAPDLVLTLAIRAVNTLNVREHWRTNAKRAQQQRYLVGAFLKDRKQRHGLPPLPAEVRLVRIGKRKMDTDGLSASFKAIRDGVQDAFGVDDGSDLFQWEYAQEQAKQYGIRIEVRSADRFAGPLTPPEGK